MSYNSSPKSPLIILYFRQVLERAVYSSLNAHRHISDTCYNIKFKFVNKGYGITVYKLANSLTGDRRFVSCLNVSI